MSKDWIEGLDEKMKPTIEIKIKCWEDQCSANYDSLLKLPKETKEELKGVLKIILKEIK